MPPAEALLLSLPLAAGEVLADASWTWGEVCSQRWY